MSAHSRGYLLAPRALNDFTDILLYTELNWGIEQRVAYQTVLLDAFQRVSETPFIGASRDNFEPGLRSFPVEQHVLIYRVTDERVEIARIVHQRKKISRRLLYPGLFMNAQMPHHRTACFRRVMGVSPTALASGAAASIVPPESLRGSP
jgi:toxin ParE1/3/4